MLAERPFEGAHVLRLGGVKVYGSSSEELAAYLDKACELIQKAADAFFMSVDAQLFKAVQPNLWPRPSRKVFWGLKGKALSRGLIDTVPAAGEAGRYFRVIVATRRTAEVKAVVRRMAGELERAKVIPLRQAIADCPGGPNAGMHLVAHLCYKGIAERNERHLLCGLGARGASG